MSAALLAGCSAPATPPPALVLADAERFASLFEAQGGRPDAAALRAGYLDPGWPGVKLFMPYRIESADNLAGAVARPGPTGSRSASRWCAAVWPRRRRPRPGCVASFCTR